MSVSTHSGSVTILHKSFQKQRKPLWPCDNHKCFWGLTFHFHIGLRILICFWRDQWSGLLKRKGLKWHSLLSNLRFQQFTVPIPPLPQICPQPWGSVLFWSKDSLCSSAGFILEFIKIFALCVWVFACMLLCTYVCAIQAEVRRCQAS